MGKLLQMEGQGVTGDAQVVSQDTGSETFRARNDQRAEHAKALGVSQGSEGRNGLSFIHGSMIQRLLN
jgi:hypothetical protein